MARSFGLVLAGGGARGFAHAGVLRALEHARLRPSVLVGVSMGAVVAATYALNPNWYEDLKRLESPALSSPPTLAPMAQWSALRKLAELGRAARNLYFGWGLGADLADWGRSRLRNLTLGRRLEDAHTPIFVGATDLHSGERVILDRGAPDSAIYASCALAGVLPPWKIGGRLLVDGGYADIAPIDVARKAGADIVVVVDPGGKAVLVEPTNGLDVLMRSVEICQAHHATLRFAEADIVLAPRFEKAIGTLDFSAKRLAIACGANCARQMLPQLHAMLRG